MTKQKARKTFILDTNVILHDSACIRHFDEHDIIVPITVLEELDHFKKGNQSVNFHAREFVRSLDDLSAKKLFNGGVPLGEDKGNLSIKLEQEPHPELQRHFPAFSKPDHRILNICYHLYKGDKSRSFILVTKDVNLRMKARAVGLMAENYISDHVKDLGALYTGTRIIDDSPFGLIDELHTSGEIPANDLDVPQDHPLTSNEFIILREANKSALATYHSGENKVQLVRKEKACGITPRNAEQTFAIHALCNTGAPLVTISGKAGTGKTLLALASALEQRRNYRQIMLARPVVPLSNKDLGFLPGDIQSKIGPYMQPLYDNLAVIRSQFDEKSKMHQKINDLLEEKKLIIEPLAYIRGRSLVKMYIIIDEAQNLTPHEVKTIITRAGEDTKIVFTGDVHQIDHPYLDSQSNGLSYLIEKMRGQHLYSHITLQKGERSTLSMLASELL
ncbi:MAG: PhoH family protein [Candidatus Electrothrix aestuarii]|uniref:PhoH family protein n=1 Tax=Candidatus Electrothrix aestuarii TaxID=3062594 RepID=A0AAU8LUY7_9BACT|nr:PhoH family protein [Candidatus Electrothrix aestuarii]WPD20859.1 MAG: PhoH family protein [Candidatus Electrothrix sp. GW3-3]